MSCWLCNNTEKVYLSEQYVNRHGNTEFFETDIDCPVCNRNYLEWPLEYEVGPFLEALDDCT